MSELLKIVRVYIVLGVLMVGGLVAYKTLQTWSWTAVPGDYRFMTPYLQPQAMVRIDKTVRSTGQLKAGDIVAYINNSQEQALKFGRVVGLPGQRVAIVKGDPVVNGEKLSEPYITKQVYMGGQTGPATLDECYVPRNHLYLLVDERDADIFKGGLAQEDSRGMGPVSVHRLKGKVVR